HELARRDPIRCSQARGGQPRGRMPAAARRWGDGERSRERGDRADCRTECQKMSHGSPPWVSLERLRRCANAALTGCCDMEFRILGPLEVRDGNVVLPVTGEKQRALLAILLLHANDVVSSDRLLDELWGSEPPESGPTALQVRVSQLRKALGPAAP